MMMFNYLAQRVYHIANFSNLTLWVFPLPFTFWTDLGYKELPVKITEGSILTEHNRSINWNLSL